MNDEDHVSNQAGSGAAVRRLIRSCDRAVLATQRADNWPYASLVLTAATHAGAPLLLVSDLAEHTRNIRSDDRISLLYDGTAGLDDPLTGSRVSLQGLAVPLKNPHGQFRFLSRHESARDYAEFGDFNFFEIDVKTAHLVAGFGRIEWLPANAILLQGESSGALMAAEAGILAHMNADHADAIQLFATMLLGLKGEDWRLTGVDPEGADLARKGLVSRVEFSKRIEDADDARRELVRLTRMTQDRLKNNLPGRGVDG
jgi:heme iron utilization protein